MTENKNDIPKHWKVKTLGDVADYLNGRAFKPTEWEKNGLPIIRIQNLNNENAAYNYSTKEFEDKYKICYGDLLFAWSASLGAYIWRGKEAWLNQHIFKVVPKECDKNFLFFLLMKVTTELYSKSHGSGMVHITKKTFENTKILLPPLSEQKAIVEKIEEFFSELDKGIEELRTAQDQLKVYRQSLLKWAFEGKLTNDNVEDGKLPKGWKTQILGAISSMCLGKMLDKRKNRGDLKPYLRNINVRWGRFEINDLQEMRFEEHEKERYEIKEGDLIICEGGEPGRCAVWNNNKITMRIQKALHRVRMNDTNSSKYLYYYMLWASKNGTLEKYFTGTTIKHLTGKQLSKLVVPSPSLSEQQRIVEILEEKLSVCDQMEQTIAQSLQQAEFLRQSILKQAFEGKLVTVQEEIPAYTPKKIPFYQAQLFGYMIATSANNNIDHGEMTLAKNSYLIDKIYGVPTYFDYGRGHLGPYSIQMKSVLYGGSLKQFFKKGEFHIELQNSDKLFKYTNPYEARTRMAMEELSAIFSQYDDKERSYQTELLATVCKVIEDIQTTDLKAVRGSMEEWKIDLKTTKFKNKAEKFSESDTASCLDFIITRGWDKRLIN